MILSLPSLSLSKKLFLPQSASTLLTSLKMILKVLALKLSRFALFVGELPFVQKLKGKMIKWHGHESGTEYWDYHCHDIVKFDFLKKNLNSNSPY